VLSYVDTEMRAVTKYLLLLWLFIMLRGKGRTFFYVRREALVPVQRSPWKKLLQRGRDQEFMLYLGINRSAFKILLSAFNRFWPRKRTRIVSSQDVLGLSLVWINRPKHFCSMFAMMQGCVSCSLDLGMACLHRGQNYHVRRSQNSAL
jgi:hypothetical protein